MMPYDVTALIEGEKAMGEKVHDLTRWSVFGPATVARIREALAEYEDEGRFPAEFIKKMRRSMIEQAEALFSVPDKEADALRGGGSSEEAIATLKAERARALDLAETPYSEVSLADLPARFEALRFVWKWFNRAYAHSLAATRPLYVVNDDPYETDLAGNRIWVGEGPERAWRAE